MEKKHRYCTHCGKELIIKDFGIVRTGFDPFTGKPVNVHSIKYQCPDYQEGFSDRNWSVGDSFFEDTPVDESASVVIVSGASTAPRCWGCSDTFMVTGCPVHDMPFRKG